MRPMIAKQPFLLRLKRMEPTSNQRSLYPIPVTFVIVTFYLCAGVAFWISFIAENRDVLSYRYLGFIALVAASLLRLPFELKAARQRRRTNKDRARAMTILQRVSSDLNAQ
ncbi:hypothetical protein [Brevundimonas sp.]|uniref:hypothetical protein n=1 Tax=Brevundimonas sp. TaxID=1871086 RepID=UPI00248737A4|nr:hypothetical protein [Brevundimonas sp.]MDI1279929.1 hypothetical protein [Brevundimonas sp.]